MTEQHRTPKAPGRRRSDLDRPWYSVPAAEMRAIIAGGITVVIITSITWLTLAHRIEAPAAIAVFTAALGYAWGAYNVDKITDRRNGNG